MKSLRAGFLFVLVAALSACGSQLVDFDADPAAPTGEAPTVTSTLPAHDAASVGLTPVISATFSEAMAPATVTATSFTVRQGTNAVAGAVAYDAPTRTATFTPAAALGANLIYTATISVGAEDLAGVPLAGPHAWVFTTAPAAAPPIVTSTTPLDLATNVAVDARPTATFSRAMAPATIGPTTFTVKQGAADVAGTVALDGVTHVATFTPGAPLLAGLVYTATITTGARDLAGLALVADRVWTFTTTPAAAPPSVTLTTPLDAAIGVTVNAKPSATFSKAMDPATIGATTFTLFQGLAPVSGVVTLDGLTHVATFTPNAPLTPGLVYTATITTGAEDSAGAPLAQNHAWSFTTDACGLAPVVLGAAEDFVVLAGSTVTSTGLTVVTGDLGVSPGTAVVGFPPGILTGALHAGTVTSAAAIADLTTAYDDAAGRSLCPVSVAGNLGGQTLTPGLYKSTSSLEITSGDLTLDAEGDADAVFIFQMASTFTTTAGRQVILAGGAKSANVYWQVGTSATLGIDSVHHGTVMADQAVTLTTGASLIGRALARIAGASLDTNSIVMPAP